MSNNDIAWFSGVIATLISAAIYFVLLITADYRPIERRALRLAILASAIVSAAVWSVMAAVYSFVSELVGNFLMFPSIVLTGIAVWHVSRITYRKTGGGKESEDRPSPKPGSVS